MDSTTLGRLLAAAIADGVVSPEASPSLDEKVVVQTSKLSTSVLLATYTRRIKHAGNGRLLAETEKLVDFLRSYPGREILMVGVYCEGGAYRAFLADENGERIIYWMRMLDADK